MEEHLQEDSVIIYVFSSVLLECKVSLITASAMVIFAPPPTLFFIRTHSRTTMGK